MGENGDFLSDEAWRNAFLAELKACGYVLVVYFECNVYLILSLKIP